MKKYLLYFNTLIIGAFCIVSCSGSSVKILNQEKMTEVLYDVHLAQALAKNSGDKYLADNADGILAGVLDKHKISRAQLDSSLMWYSDNMRDYLVISDSVTARLHRTISFARKRKDRMAEMTKDYKDLGLILPPYYYLSDASPNLAFKIDSIKLKDINLDLFKWGFDVQGLTPDHKVSVSLSFKYKDTLVTHKCMLDVDEHYYFVKPDRPDSLLRTIYGYIHLRKDTLSTSPISIYNISYLDSSSLKSDTLVAEVAELTELSTNSK